VGVQKVSQLGYKKINTLFHTYSITVIFYCMVHFSVQRSITAVILSVRLSVLHK